MNARKRKRSLNKKSSKLFKHIKRTVKELELAWKIGFNNYQRKYGNENLND